MSLCKRFGPEKHTKELINKQPSFFFFNKSPFKTRIATDICSNSQIYMRLKSIKVYNQPLNETTESGNHLDLHLLK